MKIVILGALLLCASASTLHADLSLPPARPPTTMPRDFHLRFERGACYGRCPQYTIIVDARGTVEFFGTAHVKVLDHRESGIDSDRLLRLLAAVSAIEQRAEVIKQPGCGGNIDFPTLDMYWTVNGRRGELHHKLGLRCDGAEISRREHEIDELVESAQWVEGANEDERGWRLPSPGRPEPPVRLQPHVVSVSENLSESEVRMRFGYNAELLSCLSGLRSASKVAGKVTLLLRTSPDGRHRHSTHLVANTTGLGSAARCVEASVRDYLLPRSTDGDHGFLNLEFQIELAPLGAPPAGQGAGGRDR